MTGENKSIKPISGPLLRSGTKVSAERPVFGLTGVTLYQTEGHGGALFVQSRSTRPLSWLCLARLACFQLLRFAVLSGLFMYQYGLINIFLRRYRLREVTAVIVDTCIYSNEYIYIMYRRKWVNQTVFSSTCFEASMLGTSFFEFNQSDSVADDDATGPSQLSRSLSLSPYGDVATVENALL